MINGIPNTLFKAYSTSFLVLLSALSISEPAHSQKAPTEESSIDTKSDVITFKGVITDDLTKEPLPFTTIVILKDGNLLSSTTSDFRGNYNLLFNNNDVDSINSDYLEIACSFVGYATKKIQFSEFIQASPKENININISLRLSSSQSYTSCGIIQYNVPLIHSNGASKRISTPNRATYLR